MAGTTGTKARANAIVTALLGGGAGAFDVADDPAATDGFAVEAEVVRRSAQTTVVLVSLTPAELFDGPSGFLCRDLADGSALAQAPDSTGVQCDRRTSQGFAQLDILWAVDNSTSMNDEQEQVGLAAAAMRTRLESATVEYRVAAVTSGFYDPRGQASGCTNLACGETTQNQCRAFTNDLDRFASWFQQDADGNGVDDVPWLGAGGVCNQPREEIAHGARLLLSDPAQGTVSFLPTQAAPDDVHVHQDGHLLLVFLGDADDQFYDNAGAAAGIDALEAFYRALPVASFQLGGIICPVGQTCGETQRTPHVLRALLQRFGGIEGSLRDLNAIGPTVGAILDQALVNVSPYVLDKYPITSTVKVAMAADSTVGACDTGDVPRSREHGFDVDSTTRTLAFFGDCRPDPAQLGSLIAISYRTWIDQSPVPDPPVPGCQVCASCTGVERCDLDACACVCDGELSCAAGYRWDAGVCGCVCDAGSLACDETHVADEGACACLCPANCNDACDPSSELCQASTCICRPILGG
ncbi:MAG: hypothetical protein A2138_18380 [Deltaproteobacteria bacterium RBG_16_71_12]|nr:MAG: hypothetical protein A2138_18380 [Deltaproteobacteria bacterium RBG_16_71_12]